MARKKRTARRKTSKKTGKKRRRRSKRSTFPWVKLGISLLVVLVAYIAWLDFQVYRKFEGNRWSLPARVYARPLELYVGLPLTADQFASELRALGYRFVSKPRRAGEVVRNGNRFQLISRPFDFWDGREKSMPVRVSFSGQYVNQLKNDRTGKDVAIVRLDPLEIGSIHTARQEDRILLQLEGVPEKLIEALIAVEDRAFYDHVGVSPRSVARAFLVNVQSGRVVQGGSTLTQQLVKNFFLTNRRSLVRKGNEAIMALLIERRYDKDEILEAYLNEVYLAQDGQRAIHGFGLGSRFLFQRPLDELTTSQLALLVGMVKGPSYYNPRRHPERARDRRNLVLSVMQEQGIISRAEYQQARGESLGLIKAEAGTSKTFPDFLDLVRRQLRRDYAEDDLVSEGLKIFTTLDPQVQWALQKSLDRRTRPLLDKYPDLQGAGLVSHAANGEVLALAGGRQPGYAGFNRALDARRQVGSLIKPALYLAALERDSEFSLASLIDDEALEYEDHGQLWKPNNYDRKFHGEVMLFEALAHSYNVATARLGLELGVDTLVTTLRQLGVEAPLNPYPSLFLGATDLSPLEVAELYTNFASGGFRVPLRSIRAVLDSTGEPLQRYELRVERVIEPVPAYLINAALQKVVGEGTARGLTRRFSTELGLAGKTGTTNDLRDSWYAGYDGEKLGVIWMGRDDNQAMGLTGASGAMQVWASLYAASGVTPQLISQPPGVVFHGVQRGTGLLADAGCDDRIELPFAESGILPAKAPCANNGGSDWLPEWLR